MFRDLGPILRGVDRLIFDLGALEQNGPRIVVVHRFRLRVSGEGCHPGEEVARVLLPRASQPIDIHLSLGPRLLFDHLARTRHIPQSATQVSRSMRHSQFVNQHGRNAGFLSLRKVNPSSVKEYVKRIRKALGEAFEEAQLPIDPTAVLVSRAVSNEVRYVLRSRIEWVHVDDIDVIGRSRGGR